MKIHVYAKVMLSPKQMFIEMTCSKTWKETTNKHDWTKKKTCLNQTLPMFVINKKTPLKIPKTNQ